MSNYTIRLEEKKDYREVEKASDILEKMRVECCDKYGR